MSIIVGDNHKNVTNTDIENINILAKSQSVNIILKTIIIKSNAITINII